jgi:hypothetical protein
MIVTVFAFFGRWIVPDQSSDVSVHLPSHDNMASLFIDHFNVSDAIHGISF